MTWKVYGDDKQRRLLGGMKGFQHSGKSTHKESEDQKKDKHTQKKPRKQPKRGGLDYAGCSGGRETNQRKETEMASKEIESNGTMMAGRMVGEPITKAKRVSKKKEEVVTVKNLKTEKISIKIESVEGSPLVIQKFSEKNREKIEQKQAGAGKQQRAKRDPEDDYLQAIHIDDDGHVAYPAVAFKKGMVRAADSTGDMKMTRARGAFFVLGDNVKILYKGKPIKAPTKKGQDVPGIRMRTDTVRLPNKSADMRYRPEIAEWSAQLTVIYNTAVCSAEQVVNLINTAGFAVGIGENRPEKSGNSWGMYTVSQ